MENASKALIIAGAILIAILLISIGIILINSGRDITSTGTSGMNSQKIQTFNSQFTAYEGTRKGSEIRSLVSTVNASNASDDEHQVGVVVDGATGANGAAITNAGGFVATKSYDVTINYAATVSDFEGYGIATDRGLSNTEPGYVRSVTIEDHN